MQERLFSILFDQDDITWQSLITQLVREEGMDPWDIDIAKLAERYRETIKKIKGFDVRISGKVLLAAALLLRLKSTYLLEKDIMGFDQLLASTQDEAMVDDFYSGLHDDFHGTGAGAGGSGVPELLPRTPQPRKRKVSLDDLMEALRKALEVRERRVLREIEAAGILDRPPKRRDISEIIKEIYEKVLSFIRKENRPLTFDELIPSDSRTDKITTFIPLLHLATPPHGKIDLLQKEAFGTIEIVALKK